MCALPKKEKNLKRKKSQKWPDERVCVCVRVYEFVCEREQNRPIIWQKSPIDISKRGLSYGERALIFAHTKKYLVVEELKEEHENAYHNGHKRQGLSKRTKN